MQLKVFKRANGLRYTCGEKFEPDHQANCPKGNMAQLHVLTLEDMDRVMTSKILEQVNQEEKQQEEDLQLSPNVIPGFQGVQNPGVK
jgi:hypothetical protein